MTIFQETLQHISLGEAQQSGRLTVFPLRASVETAADYALLDAAQAEGLATVSEISEGGSVPELLLDNSATVSLFLLDGEELLGAKQNRIVNLSLLVPGLSKQTIPVSCVEAGRWHYRSDNFESTDRAFFASGRARKSADVSASLRKAESRRTDQGAVWDDVSFALADFQVESATAAVSDLFEDRAESLDTLESDFRADTGEVGAVFVIDGEVRGIELFDASSTWQALMPKVLRSYAIDAMRGAANTATTDKSDGSAVSSAVQSFLKNVGAAATEEFEALGEGRDVRIMEDGLSGGALWAKGRVVHLCAFALNPDARASRRGGHSVPVDEFLHGRTVEANDDGGEV